MVNDIKTDECRNRTSYADESQADELKGGFKILCLRKFVSAKIRTKPPPWLKGPHNAVGRQYQRLLDMHGVSLEFTDGALNAVARAALRRGGGVEWVQVATRLTP